jgi:gas vesicle structural protein
MSAERESGAVPVEVLDRVLDKGIVIDAHVSVAVVGVELLAVEARVVVASIQTYLTHADALAFTPTAARPPALGADGPTIVQIGPGEAAPAAYGQLLPSPAVQEPPPGSSDVPPVPS